LDDLKGGLQVYEKIYRSLLCTQRVSERTLTSTWLDTQLKAQTKDEFKTIKDNGLSSTAAFSFVEP
jgi:hypothetical protein